MNVQARSSPILADVNDLFADIPMRMTTKEFFAHTQQAERQYQLLNGRSMMNPAPSLKHQRVVGNLHFLLSQMVRTNQRGSIWLAPCDVVLGRFNVVQPDLFFIVSDRSHIATGRTVQGAPDLAIEVLSSSTADLDRGYKQYLYAAHGVREYWLVDPDAERVEVLALGETGYATVGVYGADATVTSPLLADLHLAINSIFGA